VWNCRTSVAMRARENQDFWFQAGGAGFPGERGILRFRAEFLANEPPNPCMTAPPSQREPAAPATGSGAAPDDFGGPDVILGLLLVLSGGFALVATRPRQ